MKIVVMDVSSALVKHVPIVELEGWTYCVIEASARIAATAVVFVRARDVRGCLGRRLINVTEDIVQTVVGVAINVSVISVPNAKQGG